MTFDDAEKLYMQHLRALRRSPRTIIWYEEQLAAYRKWATVTGFSNALPSADIIDEYIAAQDAGGLAPATVHARFRALRALFRFLEKRRKLSHDANPVHLLEAPTVPIQVRRYVTPEELDTLMAGITGHTWLDHRDRVIFLVLFYSGLRLGELCGLNVDDIDLQRLEITIRHAKGNKARVVPTVEELRSVLTAYYYTRPNHTPVLLLASDGYGGNAGSLTAEGVRQMLKRRCRRVGIEPPFSPHAFRHGFAMWLLNNGARLTTVSTAMGHSDPNITHEIYAHTTTTTVRKEYDEARKRLGRP